MNIMNIRRITPTLERDGRLEQGWRKCCSAVARLRAEQGPCEPSKGFVSKFREPERAWASQREPDSEPERARESLREPDSEPERARVSQREPVRARVSQRESQSEPEKVRESQRKSLWLSVALSLALSGSLWLTLAHSCSLWPPIKSKGATGRYSGKHWNW